MNSRDLLVVFRKAHGMNLQGSLHSAKAVELLRRLVTLEHRIFELDRQAAALMKKVRLIPVYGLCKFQDAHALCHHTEISKTKKGFYSFLYRLALSTLHSKRRRLLPP